jgi:hypothetical protein
MRAALLAEQPTAETGLAAGAKSTLKPVARIGQFLTRATRWTGRNRRHEPVRSKLQRSSRLRR